MNNNYQKRIVSPFDRMAIALSLSAVAVLGSITGCKNEVKQTEHPAVAQDKDAKAQVARQAFEIATLRDGFRNVQQNIDYDLKSLDVNDDRIGMLNDAGQQFCGEFQVTGDPTPLRHIIACEEQAVGVDQPQMRSNISRIAHQVDQTFRQYAPTPNASDLEKTDSFIKTERLVLADTQILKGEVDAIVLAPSDWKTRTPKTAYPEVTQMERAEIDINNLLNSHAHEIGPQKARSIEGAVYTACEPLHVPVCRYQIRSALQGVAPETAINDAKKLAIQEKTEAEYILAEAGTEEWQRAGVALTTLDVFEESIKNLLLGSPDARLQHRHESLPVLLRRRPGSLEPGLIVGGS